MHQVHVKHYNEKAEIVDEEDFPLDVYCLRLAHNVLRLLEEIEESGIDQDSKEYKKIRHRIFDICGSLQRLPNNLK